jgi:hypothetical protein
LIKQDERFTTVDEIRAVLHLQNHDELTKGVFPPIHEKIEVSYVLLRIDFVEESTHDKTSRGCDTGTG